MTVSVAVEVGAKQKGTGQVEVESNVTVFVELTTVEKTTPRLDEVFASKDMSAVTGPTGIMTGGPGIMYNTSTMRYGTHA